MTHPLATRRALLGAALAGAVAGPLRAATEVPEAALLMAPGPQDGTASRLAQEAARGLGRALVQATALRVAVVGGPDGITAANRFATNTATQPVLLVLPGLAGQALLVGDPRARFEPRRWPALAASLQPAILAGRGAAGSIPSIRLAVPSPAAPEMAALLALETLGATASPVAVPAGISAEATVAAGAADAVVLSGPGVLDRAAALGLTPWFAFDDAAGTRDPALPAVPALGEFLPDPASPGLLAAIRAAGAALRVRGLLVLPVLTPADTVALWRDTARRWIEAEADGAAPGTRLLAMDPVTRLPATLCPPADVALAYREWLLRRTGWQPA